MMKKAIAWAVATALLLGSFGVYADDDTDSKTIDELTSGEYGGDDEGARGQTFTGTVTVRESSVVREVAREIMGTGNEWTVSGANTVLAAGETTEMSPQYQELVKQIRYMPSHRTAGASLVSFNWETSVGPLAQRGPGDKGMPDNWPIGGQVLRLGPVEWVKSALEIDPDCRFIVGLNVHHDTPQHLLEYVEFMIGDAQTTKWGKKRAEYGLPDPVNVLCFELGNEPNYQFTEAEDYIKVCSETIDLINEHFPEAKIGVGTYSYPLEMPLDSMDWRSWNIKLFEAIGGKIDYLQHHPYYDGHKIYHIETYLDRIKQDLYDVIGENDVEYILTEQAKWPEAGGTAGVGTSDSWALSGCLSTADFLNRMHVRRDVRAASYFSYVTAGAWAWFVNVDGRLYLTGMPYMYNVYNDALGELVVENTVESDSKYVQKDTLDSKFTVLATTLGDRELSLILVNKSPDMKVDLTFDFENDYTLISETTFTAPEYYSMVMDEATRDIFQINTTEKEEKGFAAYHMPAMTMVTLRLRANRPFGQGGGSEADETVYQGETLFSDLGDFWGSNEVQLLAAEGVLDQGTYFYPYREMTRGEFAVMTDKVLGLGGSGQGSVFTDVSQDVWYAPAVGRLYENGLLRGVGGGAFSPEAPISGEEAVVVVMRALEAAQPAPGGRGLEQFAYREDISPWAMPSVSRAVEAGVLNRLYENGRFAPKAAAKRGETAVLLYRARAKREK